MGINSKKGFTLTELLITIILLGIVGTIVIYNMLHVSTSSKESEYDRFIAKVISSAELYVTTNPETVKDLYEDKAFIYIKMEDLINSGEIEDDLKNPYTDETIKPDELIKVNLNPTNGELSFEYPVINQDGNGEGDTSQEGGSFLVAMSDYVVYGEPYDCMQGAGTYQFALSDENGNLISLSDQSVIDEYHFTCEYPSEFTSYDDSYPEEYRKGKYTDTPGTYNITYNWITKSGNPKTQTRTLRVLSKATPKFAIKEKFNGKETVYNYDFGSKKYYIPSYISSLGWKYLTYTPYVEGGDPKSTLYSLKKISLDPNTEVPLEGAVEETVITNSSDFSTSYPVDEGVKRYSISMEVKGHYNTAYSYKTEDSIILRLKLIPIWENVETKNAPHVHSAYGGSCYTCSNRCYSRIVRHDNRCGGYICEGAQHRCEDECACGGKINKYGNDNCNDTGGNECSICLAYKFDCNIGDLGTVTLQRSTNTKHVYYRLVYDNTSGYLNTGSMNYGASQGRLSEYTGDPGDTPIKASKIVEVQETGSFYMNANIIDNRTGGGRTIRFDFTDKVPFE